MKLMSRQAGDLPKMEVSPEVTGKVPRSIAFSKQSKRKQKGLDLYGLYNI
jgi:hypothetical protein